LLSCYVDAWHRDPMSRSGEVKTLLVCGSEMNEVNRRHVINGAGDSSLIVRDFSNDMMTCMDAADVVVSMGGYNTVCELLTLRKRAVIVPRAKPVAEQLIRAERMAALGLLRCIHPERLQPSILMNEIRSQLEQVTTAAPPPGTIDLRGLARVQEHVAGLLETAGSGSFLRPAMAV